MYDKWQKMSLCMDQWMKLREQKVTITTYFKDRGIKSIGVYGYGRLGRHLIWEIENEKYHIPWIMDQRYSVTNIDNKAYRLLSPDDTSHLQEAEMIVVTVLEDYYDIEAKLCKVVNVEVISIEQLIKIFFEG